MKAPVIVTATGLIIALGFGVARADEAKTPIKAAMVLTILSQPAELSGRALDRALLDPGPAPATAGDSSAKYGTTTVTVRNPCPPGTLHYEPPPLPGRRVR